MAEEEITDQEEKQEVQQESDTDQDVFEQEEEQGQDESAEQDDQDNDTDEGETESDDNEDEDDDQGEDDDDQKDQDEDDQNDEDDGDEDEDQQQDDEQQDTAVVYNRDTLLSTLKDKFPDQNFESTEQIVNHAAQLVGELTDYQKQNRELNGKLVQVFETNQELEGVMRDMIQGASFTEALARNIEVEKLVPSEDDPDYDKWKKNLQERQKKIEEREAYLDSLKQNTEKTKKEIAEFAKEENLDQQELTAFLSEVDKLVANVNNANVDRQTLKLLRKGMKYDTDTETIKEMADKKVKNNEINSKKKGVKGDGLPKLKSSGNKPKPKAPKEVDDDFGTGAIASEFDSKPF